MRCGGELSSDSDSDHHNCRMSDDRDVVHSTLTQAETMSYVSAYRIHDVCLCDTVIYTEFVNKHDIKQSCLVVSIIVKASETKVSR